MVCERKNREEVDMLCMHIHQLLSDSVRQAKIPYDLSVSIGYAEYTREVKSIPQFINIADNQLYLEKQKR